MKQLLSLFVFIILVFTAQAWATTYYYAKPCDSYPCSGTYPWDTPAKAGDIRTVFSGARTDANPDTVIRLTEGTYDLSVPNWGYYSWYPAVDLTIEGHDGINSLSASQIIIDGKETHTFLMFEPIANNLVLKNISIKNCISDDGLRCSVYMKKGVDLTVSNCIFDNNFNGLNHGGAAILTHGVDVTGAVEITGSIFSNNISSEGSIYGRGGALFLKRGTTLTISDCIFDSNTAWAHGGAAYIMGFTGAMLISDCIFTSNSSIGTNDVIRQGGALQFAGAMNPIIIQDCIFTGNNIVTGATAAGAIKLSQGSYGTINRCYFDSNSATQGGAIDFGGSNTVTSNIYNSVFANNAAIDTGADLSHGGAWHSINNHSVNSYNNVYYGNTADNNGNAIAFGGVATATFTNDIYHDGTLAWGDVSDLIYCSNHNAVLNITYCDIEGGADSVTDEDTYTDNINSDPKFYNASTGNFTLRRNSPCIDEGTDVGLTEDFEGTLVPQGGAPDIGAYEYIFDADLVVLSIETDPSQPEPGQVIYVYVTVMNRGSTNADGFWIDWYADLNAPPEPHQRGDRYESVDFLDAHTPYTMTVTYNYPCAGIYKMAAQVDTAQEIAEANEGNNILWDFGIVVGACDGDFDGDGDVDSSDLAVFAADFGRTDCHDGEPCEGDFENDGDVDGSDLAVFATDFGRTDCP